MVDEIRRPGCSRKRGGRVWKGRGLRRGIESRRRLRPDRRNRRHGYGLLGGLVRRRGRRLGRGLLGLRGGPGLQEGVQDVVRDGRHGAAAAGNGVESPVAAPPWHQPGPPENEIGRQTQAVRTDQVVITFCAGDEFIVVLGGFRSKIFGTVSSGTRTHPILLKKPPARDADKPHKAFCPKKGEELPVFPSAKSRERTPGSDESQIERFYLKIRPKTRLIPPRARATPKSASRNDAAKPPDQAASP